MTNLLIACMMGWLYTVGGAADSGGTLPELDNFSTKDGLVHNKITALYQEPNGPLWVGTEAGLCAFDGRKFDALRQQPLLQHRKILGLEAHPDGGFWVVGIGRLLYWHDGAFEMIRGAEDDQWDSWYQDPTGRMWLAGADRIVSVTREGDLHHLSLEGLTPPITVDCMTLLPDGRLLAGISGMGLFLYDPPRDSWTRYPNHALPHGNINAMVPDGEGGVWLATHGGLAHYLDDEVTPASINAYLETPIIRHITLGPSGGLWLTGHRNGAVYWNGSDPVFLGLDEGMPSMSLNGTSVDAEGRIWFHSNRGIAIRDPGGMLRIDKAAGLPSNFITGVLHVEPGLSWVASTQGLTRVRRSRLETLFRPSSNRIHRGAGIRVDPEGRPWFPTASGLGTTHWGAFRMITHADGLPSNVVSDVAFGPQGTPWAATESGIAYLKGDRFYKCPSLNLPLRTLTIDRRGRIWAVDRAGRLWMNPNPDQNPDGFEQEPYQSVLQVLVRRDGGVWINTSTQLILFGDRPDRKLNLESLSLQIIDRYYFEDGDYWWIATAGGIFQTLPVGMKDLTGPFEPGEKAVRILRSGNRVWVPTTRGPISFSGSGTPDRLRYLEDGIWHELEVPNPGITGAVFIDGRHLLSSANGLTWVDGSEVNHLSVDKGLAGNLVQAFAPDGEALWIATNGGLNKMKGTLLSTFSVDDGLVADTVSEVFMDTDHALWIRAGGAIQRYKEEPRAPTVVLQALYHDDRCLTPADPLTTAYDQNNLSFALRTLYPLSSEPLQYTWVLEGTERSFRGVTGEQTLRLPGLPPDQYTLILRAYNKDLYGSEPLLVPFTIRAPLWQHPLMLPSVVLLVGLLGYGFYRIRLARQLEQARVRNELNVAHDLQLALMPTTPPSVPRLDIAGTCIPALEVGGDFYDVFHQDTHQVVTTIMDVSGKSMQGAMISVLTSGLIYGRVGSGEGPGEVLTCINRTLYDKTDRKTFITGLLAVWDAREARLCFANAGHMDPMVLRGGRRLTLPPRDKRDLPLGAVRQWTYAGTSMELAPGDLVCLYTDGVTEAENAAKELYGEDRLCAVLAADPEASAAELMARLTTDIARFRGKAAQNDDITAVIFKVC